MNQLLTKISTWLHDKRFVIELVLVGLVIVTFLLKFLNFVYASTGIEITMQALAAFYLISAFIYRTNDKIFNISLMLFSINSAICVIGLLFAITHMPGAHEQLMVGLIGLAVCVLAIIILVTTGRRENVIPIFIRLVVLGGLCLNAFLGLNSISP